MLWCTGPQSSYVGCHAVWQQRSAALMAQFKGIVGYHVFAY
jgi:hypothetical protein